MRAWTRVDSPASILVGGLKAIAPSLRLSVASQSRGITGVVGEGDDDGGVSSGGALGVGDGAVVGVAVGFGVTVGAIGVATPAGVGVRAGGMVGTAVAVGCG